jgi:hypothetical protein
MLIKDLELSRCKMDYEEKVINGTPMVAFRGCWYPLYEDEDEYPEKVEDGMVMVLVDGHWYPVTEAVQDHFPFYDLSDQDLQDLYRENPLDYVWEEVYDTEYLE